MNKLLLLILLFSTLLTKDFRKITTKTYLTYNPENRKELITLIHIH